MVGADVDKDTLAAVMAARVSLAKLTEEQAIAQARHDWMDARLWVHSTAYKPGSFLWFCDLFDLEASSVRRAIVEGKK